MGAVPAFARSSARKKSAKSEKSAIAVLAGISVCWKSAKSAIALFAGIPGCRASIRPVIGQKKVGDGRDDLRVQGFCFDGLPKPVYPNG